MKSRLIPQLTLIQEEKFMQKVRITPGCWVWTASLNPEGYGRVRINSGYYYAHRVSYTIFVGEIPEGLVIDHMCRNKSCVKPTHLQPVTQGKNIWRGLRHRSLL